ncbi:hypothetical protein [uncultured Desulfobacter sp.]|uniref:hypothetical protein n=1 Tax=uncultured Desulfobacter sp. TaxID=240139 RepID=UPI0029F4CC1D|nr:hypothetical protein [uncultured Desulfobacter sp.]
MKRFFLFFIIAGIIILNVFLLLYGYYLLSFALQCSSIGGLFFFYKATSNKHIEHLVLVYLKKHNGATKNELIAHIKKKTGEKANVNLSAVVDDIIENLKIKELVFIEKGIGSNIGFCIIPNKVKL